MAWTVEALNAIVDAELAELPADMRARLVRISELIESVGRLHVKEPHVRHIRGPHVTAREQHVVILRAFIKKTEKTPPAGIELALQRAKELKPWRRSAICIAAGGRTPATRQHTAPWVRSSTWRER